MAAGRATDVVPSKVTTPPEKPTMPEPVPSSLIETTSSASSPETVSEPPPILPSLSETVTLASSSRGVALTVFSAKVMAVARPSSSGMSLTPMTVMVAVLTVDDAPLLSTAW